MKYLHAKLNFGEEVNKRGLSFEKTRTFKTRGGLLEEVQPQYPPTGSLYTVERQGLATLQHPPLVRWSTRILPALRWCNFGYLL